MMPDDADIPGRAGPRRPGRARVTVTGPGRGRARPGLGPAAEPGPRRCPAGQRPGGPPATARCPRRRARPGRAAGPGRPGGRGGQAGGGVAGGGGLQQPLLGLAQVGDRAGQAGQRGDQRHPGDTAAGPVRDRQCQQVRGGAQHGPGRRRRRDPAPRGAGGPVEPVGGGAQLGAAGGVGGGVQHVGGGPGDVGGLRPGRARRGAGGPRRPRPGRRS